MSDDSPIIPLADVLRAANDLVSAGLIKDYALGGAMAAIHYVEPFTTYDVDSFLVHRRQTCPEEYRKFNMLCARKVGASKALTCYWNDFPVQFLAAHGLTEEAVGGKPD